MSEHFDSVEDRDDTSTDDAERELEEGEDDQPNPWAKTSSGDADEITD
jgi:hypothetical protein